MRTRWLVPAFVVVASTAHADRDRADLLSEAAERSALGDHEGAIDIYEHVYHRDNDLDLLVRIGAEYRTLGRPNDAIRYYCTYLTLEPSGPNAPLATNEVVSMQAKLGNWVPSTNACAPGVPLFPTPPTVITPATTMPVAVAPVVRSTSTRELAGISVAALGVVGLTAGVYFGLQAGNISDDIASHDPSTAWPDNIQSLEDRGQRAEKLESMFLVGGGLALVTGGVLYFTGRADRISNERVSITPSVSKAGGGIAISGAF